MREPQIILAVATLLSLRGPSAIRRLLLLSAFVAMTAGVASVRVDAVESVQLAWSDSDICDEVRDGLTPSRTDIVTASAIEPEVVVFIAVTAGNHLAPNCPLACAAQSILGAVNTTTTSDLPGLQMVRTDSLVCSAFAKTIPISAVTFVDVVGFRLNDKTSKCVSYDGLRVTNLPNSLRISHDVSFPEKDACG